MNRARKAGVNPPHSIRFATWEARPFRAKRMECVRFTGAFRFMADEQFRQEQVALPEPTVPGGARLLPSHPVQDSDRARQQPRPTRFMATEQVQKEQGTSHAL